MKSGILLNIQLITDGGADIPSELSENITVVPLYLRFNNTEFKTGKDIDSQTFHDKVKKFKQVPTSSAPSPNDFYEALKTTDPTKPRSEEHTSELQSRGHLVCRLLLEKKKKATTNDT